MMKRNLFIKMISFFAPFLTCLLILTTTASTLSPTQALTKRVGGPEDIANFNILRTRGQILYNKMLCGEYLDSPDITIDSLRASDWRVNLDVARVDVGEQWLLTDNGDSISGQTWAATFIHYVPDPETRSGRTSTSAFAGSFFPRMGIITAKISSHNHVPGANDAHISDLMMAAWRDLCAQSNVTPAGGLRRYYGRNISNANTIEAWVQARGSVPRRNVRETYTPTGRNIDTFFALLGSPNAIRIPYMLLTYSPELGQKIVTSITMQFDLETGYSMVINIGDVSRTATGSQWRQWCCMA